MNALLSPRYLTKTRFKLGLECPTKLFYMGKPGYQNNSAENSFLRTLAEGGYQVGALACLMYPDGVEVDDPGHAEQIARTCELLARDEVTIYEAAFEARGLFVRVDILRKRGNVVELIEVKAKSWHPVKVGNFCNAKGVIKSGYLPYLQDIAFQRYVAGLAFPEFAYRSFLMMADTSRTATVDGLNQRFRIKRANGRTNVVVAPGTDAVALGEPILTAIGVDDQVAGILAGEIVLGARSLPFPEAVRELADAYAIDRRIDPVARGACGTCEFKSPEPPHAGELKSGFHECWRAALGWSDADFAGGTVLDLWNFQGKDELIRRGVVKLGQVTEQDLGFDGSEPGVAGMTARHRQWYQCSGSWPQGGAFYLDRSGLAADMREWRYPLHFIDFETSTVPIPFTRGRRPYETTAFQFSHHVLHQDGCLEHRTQFLDATPGRSPNVAFVRALREALETDGGTVFRWATHENTVLNQLRRQLLHDAAAPDDADDLVRFIETVTTRKVDGVEIVGPRSMVDLCKLAEKFFFHPATHGSSSLKKVLPALMASSAFLRDRYGAPVYGTDAMPSKNLTTPVAWWQERDRRVCDPYDLLPPVFVDLRREEQDALDAGLVPELQEGGAAMAAYARLQFEDLTEASREAWRQRCCATASSTRWLWSWWWRRGRVGCAARLEGGLELSIHLRILPATQLLRVLNDLRLE